MSKYFQSKVSGITIDDSALGSEHAWSANRIVSEIVAKLKLSKLSSLADVSLVTVPSNAQVLSYNTTTSKWEAKTIVLTTKFSELTDVDVSSLENGYSVKYDSTLKKFVTFKPEMKSLLDYNPAGIVDGDVIGYDASTNSYKPIKAKAKLRELTDVNSTKLEDKSLIQYSLAEDKFKTVPMFRLEDLRNISTSGIADGFVLVYNQSQNNFTFKKVDAKAKLSELLDVNTSGVTNGSILKYSSTTNLYETAKLAVKDLTDIDISNIQDGYTLKWNNTLKKFVPTPFPEGGGTGGGGTTPTGDTYIEQNLYEYNINNTQQTSKIGIVASLENPRTVDIIIPYTEDFNLGKLEVLKFEASSEQINNLVKFDNTDSTDFTFNENNVSFNGTMHLRTDISQKNTSSRNLGDLGNIFSIPFSKSGIKMINEVKL